MAEPIKSYVITYLNQTSYMEEKGIPIDSDELKKYIEEKLSPQKFAFIEHSKDKSEIEGKEFVEPHIHIVMRFTSKRSLNAIAKLFGDDPQHFAPSGSWNNSASYLVHATKGAQHKYQYSPSEVTASDELDYPALVEKIARIVQKATDTQNEEYIRQFANREITKKQLRERLADDYEFTKFDTDIRRIEKLHADDDYVAFKKEMELKNEPIKIRWITGATGTGKSSFSRDYAKNVLGVTPYIAQNAKSTFDDYQQEKCIIFEEFGPNEIPLKEMLILLDNWSYDKRASARYRHRALTVSQGFIVNSRLSISEFWKAIKDPEKGSVSQMYRRMSEIYFFEDKDFTQLYCENLTIDECEKFLNERYDEILNPDDVNEEFAKLTASNDHETRIAVLLESDSVYENIYTKDQRAENLFAHQKEHLHQDLSKLKGHSKGVEKNE